MSTVTLPSGVTERTTLPCTSLNQSVPSGRHSGPSVNLKPPGDLLDDGARRDERVERRIEPFDRAGSPPADWRPSRAAAGGAGTCPPQPDAIRPASASTNPLSFQRHRYTSS